MLELDGISKKYGPAHVLDDVSVTVRAGEVHAIVGENGAGKSTLMRIAAGMVRPDRGNVVVSGKLLRNATPRAARSAGVEMVTQELTSVPARTVLENAFLGVPVAGIGSLRRSAASRAVRKNLRRDRVLVTAECDRTRFVDCGPPNPGGPALPHPPASCADHGRTDLVPRRKAS